MQALTEHRDSVRSIFDAKDGYVLSGGRDGSFIWRYNKDINRTKDSDEYVEEIVNYLEQFDTILISKALAKMGWKVTKKPGVKAKRKGTYSITAMRDLMQIKQELQQIREHVLSEEQHPFEKLGEEQDTNHIPQQIPPLETKEEYQFVKAVKPMNQSRSASIQITQRPVSPTKGRKRSNATDNDQPQSRYKRNWQRTSKIISNEKKAIMVSGQQRLPAEKRDLRSSDPFPSTKRIISEERLADEANEWNFFSPSTSAPQSRFSLGHSKLPENNSPPEVVPPSSTPNSTDLPPSLNSDVTDHTVYPTSPVTSSQENFVFDE